MNGAAPMTPTQEDREAAAEWSFGRTDFASFSPADRFEVEEVAKFIAGIRLAAEERGARMAGLLGPGLDHIAHFINSLDSEGMTPNEVRSAIYAECISPTLPESRKAK